MSVIDELEKIQKLKEQGILTEEEFEDEKSKILNKNTKVEKNNVETEKNVEKIETNINTEKQEIQSLNRNVREHKKKVCKNCGNEIQEGEKFCGKCGNKITTTNDLERFNLKNKTSLIFIVVFIVIMVIVVVINNNRLDTAIEQAKSNSISKSSSSSSNISNNNKRDEKLNLENIKLQTWYNSNDTNIDGATLRLFNVAWQGIIKEYYPNAILNKFTIYDKDNYGRYIVGINFTKSSTSESSTYNWCCVWVKDINDLNKIGYWKTNPMGVSYIYNDSSYGWGTPLPNNL